MTLINPLKFLLLLSLLWAYGYKPICPVGRCPSFLVDAFGFYQAFVIVLIGYFFSFSEVKLRLTKSFWVFLGVLGLLVFVTAPFLTHSLVSDHYYHANQALSVPMNLASNYCDANPDQCLTLPFSDIIQKFSRIGLFLFVLFCGIFLKALHGRSTFIFVGLGLLFVISSQVTTPLANGGNLTSFDIHPPLRLLPLWVSSAILGIKVTSFRIVGLVALAGLGGYIYHFLSSRISQLTSLLAALALATLPLLVHSSVIVEPSIWTAVAWVGFLLFLFYEEPTAEKVTLWFGILSIATLMRATALIGLVTLSVYWLVVFLQRNNWKRLFSLDFLRPLVSVFVALPFAARSIVAGGPASGTKENGLLSHLLDSLAHFEAFFHVLNAIGPVWLLFLPLAFAPLFFKEKKLGAYFATFHLLIAFVAFYSIRKVLWGLPRYQAELWLPFVIVGFIHALIWLESKKLKSVGLVVLGSLVIFNLFVTLNLPKQSQFGDEPIFASIKKGNVFGVSEVVYDYDKVIQKAVELGFTGELYIDGITYGEMPEILNGFTYANILASRDFGHPWGGANVADIQSNTTIQAVILADWTPSLKKAEELQNLGWKIQYKAINPYFHSTTLLLSRN
ncbi:MAG: hypothetical protein QNL04_09985 [SAR324 cluster bacterium]|nr:hypothetical protein [SAR324 cluster bacterium]